jgi:4-diphosphocytidyl-2-C-methyl-D-erythritol kinase
MSNSSLEYAYAKINLFLHILGKYDNGYHNLESMVVFADLSDELEIISGFDSNSLNITGEFSGNLIGTNILNIIANKFNSNFNISNQYQINLKKNIPVSAGIGGGSADAAAFLRYLAYVNNINYKDQSFLDFAAKIGADIPCCLYSSNLLFSGIGEKIKQISLPKLHMILVNPRKNISTKDIFNSIKTTSYRNSINNISDFRDVFELVKFLKSHTNNDLQQYVISNYVEIKDVIDVITQTENCLFTRMSGSGATCFGIYENKDMADNAVKYIRSLKSDWWVRSVASI